MTVIIGGVGGVIDSPAQSIGTVTATAQPLGDWLGCVESQRPAGATSRRSSTTRGLFTSSVPGARPRICPARSISPGSRPRTSFCSRRTTVSSPCTMSSHQRTPLVPHHARLLGRAWCRGHHPWVAAGFSDGTPWRKNLVTGVEATTARVPPFERRVQFDGTWVVTAERTPSA